MIGWKVKVTPSFLIFRGGEMVNKHGGINEANLHKARRAPGRLSAAAPGGRLGRGVTRPPRRRVPSAQPLTPPRAPPPAPSSPLPLQYITQFLKEGEAGYGSFNEAEWSNED